MRPVVETKGCELYECPDCSGRYEDVDGRYCPDCGGTLYCLDRSRDL